MKHLVRALASFIGLTLSLGLAAQNPAVTKRTPEENRDLRRKTFVSGRELLLRSGVPFEPNELIGDHWRQSLLDTLEAMPQMHEARYETKPLHGVYLADTLYLPEHVRLDGETVILVKHLVFEGKNVGMGGPHSLHLFPMYPTEVMGKSLREILLDGGLPALRENHPPPSFDELCKALNLDPYRHGKRYEQVFEPRRISFDVSGKPGEKGADGKAGEPVSLTPPPN